MTKSITGLKAGVKLWPQIIHFPRNLCISPLDDLTLLILLSPLLTAVERPDVVLGAVLVDARRGEVGGGRGREETADPATVALQRISVQPSVL